MVLTVGDFRDGDAVVADSKVGWILKYPTHVELFTTRGVVPLSWGTPARAALRTEAAEVLLVQLVSPEPPPLEPTTLAELGLALRISMRTLRLLLRRRNGSVEPPDSPRDYPAHDYMGTFDVAEELVVADPCYVGERRPLLALRVPARPGRWHAYIRADEGCRDLSVAMFVVHETHVPEAKLSGDELGMFGVDSGSVVIGDARLGERLGGRRELEEGIVEDLGCFAETAAGDGLFAARVHRVDGRAVMLRASLSEPELAHYTPPASKEYVGAVEAALAGAEVRAYSPKLVLAVGERIRHPQLGDGVVTSVVGDKVEIAFRDRVRTLVHRR